MSLRDTPTAQDVIDILEARRWDPLAAMISARWFDAIDLMTSAFATTGSAAEDLLSRLVTTENGPLLAIRVPDRGPVERMVHAERDIGRAWRREWRPLEVPELVHTWLRLTHEVPTDVPNGCFWVLRRSSLRAICVHLAPPGSPSLTNQHHAVEHADPSERDACDPDRFDELHGDDLRVIAAFVEQSLPAGTEPWQRQQLISAKVAAGLAGQYGTDGQVTIVLRGSQISAFANRLR